MPTEDLPLPAPPEWLVNTIAQHIQGNQSFSDALAIAIWQDIAARAETIQDGDLICRTTRVLVLHVA